jgi:hypothetical protein
LTVAKHYEYTYFNVIPAGDKRWFVQTKATCTIIGRIEWYPKWRQYVMAPDVFTIWSKGCLDDLASAIEKIKGDTK